MKRFNYHKSCGLVEEEHGEYVLYCDHGNEVNGKDKRIIELEQWQSDIMSVLPVSHSPTHTPNNAVYIIKSLLNELVEQEKLIDNQNDKLITINISKGYTTRPGLRYEHEYKFSGERFRKEFLEKHFENGSTGTIRIILDNSTGFTPGFLEETFGGLSRKYGKDEVLKRIEIVSNDIRWYIDEIKEYIENAQ